MNRWAHLDNMLKFYISRQRKIVEHMDVHVHFKLLSTKWSMIMLIIALAINEINKTLI